MDCRKTSLFKTHERENARLADFHGWMMPIQYTSILAEHEAVRKSAGMFDISHMGEIMVFGENSVDFLQGLLTNNVDVEPGKCVYTLMCNEEGGILDDLIICRLEAERFMLVVNASNTRKDLDWIRKRRADGVGVADESKDTSAIALQGPESSRALRSLAGEAVLPKRFRISKLKLSGFKTRVSRTGYTGEDGFEIYMDNDDAEKLWKMLGEMDVKPCGLGSRDTLRLEMGYPLHGNDITAETTPVEAGLSWAVDLNKEFTGKPKIERQARKGADRKLVGLISLERGIPRRGYEILKNGEQIGVVTSGAMSPTLRKGVGMGYIKMGAASQGDKVNIVIRDKEVSSKITKPPFIKK